MADSLEEPRRYGRSGYGTTAHILRVLLSRPGWSLRGVAFCGVRLVFEEPGKPQRVCQVCERAAAAAGG